jgi:AcrR family transcriptional regulator
MMEGMGRWEPNSRGRLEKAALELYGERGYEQTTVAEIAQRAGLTERTFFRHFADKREVLFGGSELLKDLLVDGIATAPEPLIPVDAVAAALQAAAAFMQDGRERAMLRQVVIDANPELQERELIKLATLSAAVAEALRAHGVPDLRAALAAETGLAVFKVAFTRWIRETDPPPLADVIRETFGELTTQVRDH